MIDLQQDKKRRTKDKKHMKKKTYANDKNF